MCFVHPSHLSRKFKQDTGVSIKYYYQSIRIERAKYFLKTEGLSIEEISWLAGYEDSSYFTRVFKNLMNMTPSEHKKT